jgi:putative endonuclease
MYYVYVLDSLGSCSKIYIGFTENLGQRLVDHNNGKSTYTSKYRPWKIIYYCAFEKKEKALEFERYLKSGSGKSFLYKRLI